MFGQRIWDKMTAELIGLNYLRIKIRKLMPPINGNVDEVAICIEGKPTTTHKKNAQLRKLSNYYAFYTRIVYPQKSLTARELKPLFGHLKLDG